MIDDRYYCFIGRYYFTVFLVITDELRLIVLLLVWFMKGLFTSTCSHGNRICAVCHIMCHYSPLHAFSWLAGYTDHHAHTAVGCWVWKISAHEWINIERFCHRAWLCYGWLLFTWTQAVTVTCHQVIWSFDRSIILNAWEDILQTKGLSLQQQLNIFLNLTLDLSSAHVKDTLGHTSTPVFSVDCCLLCIFPCHANW